MTPLQLSTWCSDPYKTYSRAITVSLPPVCHDKTRTDKWQVTTTFILQNIFVCLCLADINPYLPNKVSRNLWETTMATEVMTPWLKVTLFPFSIIFVTLAVIQSANRVAARDCWLQLLFTSKKREKCHHSVFNCGMKVVVRIADLSINSVQTCEFPEIFTHTSL